MHPEAYEGFGRMITAARVDPTQQLAILDIGGQNVNGSVHDHFTHPETTVTTLDLENADIIADATTWVPDKGYDLVIATELFEHVKDWTAVISTMWAALRPGGSLIATCASTNRPAHGATGAPQPAPGEWYANVDPGFLRVALSALFVIHHVEYRYPPGDAYMWATR